MSLFRFVKLFAAFAFLAAACGGTGAATTTSPATSSPITTATSTTSFPQASSTTATTSTTTTLVPESECEPGTVLFMIDAAIAAARLAEDGEWSTDTAGNRFAERTATGDEFADRLGLDCGLTASQSIGEDERFVIAAWTGPRMAWVIQTSEVPATPYAREATVTVLIDTTEGEFLDGEERSLWAGTFDGGETLVIGHVDYNLGAVAKDWVAGPQVPFDEEIGLASEQHGIDALKAAGMRNIGIGEPPEFGSEEGHVQFISPSGQISVADIGPTGWFDPLEPRYVSGPTRFVTIDGVGVRITEPDPDDNAGYSIGAEVGFACEGFVWLLQPPANGDVDEMLETATGVIATEECRAH